MKVGRVIGTALVGLFFMLFLAVDLVLFGVIALDSIVVTLLLAIGLVGGGVLGWFVAGRAGRPAMATVAGGAPSPPPPPPPPPPPA